MKLRNQKHVSTAARSGMTLIELTVVILVLLSLLSILFVGARAWKRGSDRVGCIMQIRNVQVGVRSFANLNGYVEEQDVAPRDLKSEVIGSDKFVQTDPQCPGKGTYKFRGNRIPKVGALYMKCSLNRVENHRPKRPHKNW